MTGRPAFLGGKGEGEEVPISQLMSTKIAGVERQHIADQITNHLLFIASLLAIPPGKWYEVSKSSFFASIFERDGYCITAEYTDNGDGTIQVDNGLSKGGPDGERKDALATAKQLDGAALGVSFFLPKVRGGERQNAIWCEIPAVIS